VGKQLRAIAPPFVAAAPAVARVRTRLRLSAEDHEVLRAVGRHLGALAGKDLAAPVRRGAPGRQGQGRVPPRAETVADRRVLVPVGGTITRVSEDAWQLANRNLTAERASLAARVRKIEARAAVPAGTKAGRVEGYATPAERHGKTIRLKALRSRLARVERRIADGRVSVTRGGRRLMRARLNLQEAGLTEQQWRAVGGRQAFPDR
jgi:hypothetical protein